ncbi:RNA polymerase sigma factor [Kitasatospora sp. NPDC003701]
MHRRSPRSSDRSARLPAPRAGDERAAEERDTPHPGAEPAAEPEDDAELTERLRSGEDGVASVLYARHHPAVLAHARSLGPAAGTAEDLASEAFTRTLAAVRAGSGPTGSWRPYLLTVVRNTAMAWASADRRTVLTADVEPLADRNTAALSPDQILASAVERDLVLAAYRTLPRRWRTALRHSVVEQRPTEEVAELLGLTGSGASSLLARAHEGLRRAYLAAHLQGPDSPECLAHTDRLKALARHPARRKSKLLTRHLEDCAPCRHRYEEMRDINRSLRLARTALLGPTPDAPDSTAAAPAPGPATGGAAPGPATGGAAPGPLAADAGDENSSAASNSAGSGSHAGPHPDAGG